MLGPAGRIPTGRRSPGRPAAPQAALAGQAEPEAAQAQATIDGVVGRGRDLEPRR